MLKIEITIFVFAFSVFSSFETKHDHIWSQNWLNIWKMKKCNIKRRKIRDMHLNVFNRKRWIYCTLLVKWREPRESFNVGFVVFFSSKYVNSTYIQMYISGMKNNTPLLVLSRNSHKRTHTLSHTHIPALILKMLTGFFFVQSFVVRQSIAKVVFLKTLLANNSWKKSAVFFK